MTKANAGQGEALPGSAEEIERALSGLAREIDTAKTLQAKRAALFRAGRALDPPMSFRRLGRAAKVTTSAVVQSLERYE